MTGFCRKSSVLKNWVSLSLQIDLFPLTVGPSVSRRDLLVHPEDITMQNMCYLPQKLHS